MTLKSSRPLCRVGLRLHREAPLRPNESAWSFVRAGSSSQPQAAHFLRCGRVVVRDHGLSHAQQVVVGPFASGAAASTAVVLPLPPHRPPCATATASPSPPVVASVCVCGLGGAAAPAALSDRGQRQQRQAARRHRRLRSAFCCRPSREHVVPCRVAPEWVLLIPPRRSLGVVDVQAASEPGVAGPVLLAHLMLGGNRWAPTCASTPTSSAAALLVLCHCHRL